MTNGKKPSKKLSKDKSAKGTSKETSASKQQSIGPFKYSYSQLEKDGIIKESEVPKERYIAINMLIPFSLHCLSDLLPLLISSTGAVT